MQNLSLLLGCLLFAPVVSPGQSIHAHVRASVKNKQGGGSLEIREDARGRRQLVRIDAKGERQVENLDAAGLPPEFARTAATTEPSRPAEETTQIDLLVAYTPAARRMAGSGEAMEQQIDLALAETNAGFEASGVTLRLRLALATEVPYRESGDLSLDLDRLARPADGSLDEVPRLRTSFGADLVSLWVADGDACAQAYSVASVSVAQPGAGFHVVRQDCALRGLSFAHAVGRNLGAGNARDDGTGPGAFPFAYAFKQPSGDSPFRTVMAFDQGCRCPRVNRWSSPLVRVEGQPAGVANVADNVTALNRIGLLVAGYRPPTLPADPASKLPESLHPYPEGLDQTWTYTIPGARGLTLAFDERTYVETGRDYIHIVSGTQTQTFTGDALAGAFVFATGDTVKIRLVSDSGGPGYGFRLRYVYDGALASTDGPSVRLLGSSTIGASARPTTAVMGQPIPPWTTRLDNFGRLPASRLRVGYYFVGFDFPNGLLAGTCTVAAIPAGGGSASCSPALTVPDLRRTGTLRMRVIIDDWGTNPVNSASREEFDINITGGSAAALTSPVAGSVLAGPEATFRWTAGVSALGYRLQVGRSAGGGEYFDQPIGQLSTTVTNLPVDGRPIYVRLSTTLGTPVTSTTTTGAPPETRFRDTVVRAAWRPPTGDQPLVTIQDFTAPGTAIIGQALTPVRLLVVNQGETDAPPFRVRFRFNSGEQERPAEGFCAIAEGLGPGQSASCEPNIRVPGLLRPGRWGFSAVAVEDTLGRNLSPPATVANGGVQLTGLGAAEITLPLAGATLPAAATSFRWEAVADAEEYRLSLGSRPGASDVALLTPGRALNAVVETLPRDGRKLFARLETRFGEEWTSWETTYRAPVVTAGLRPFLSVAEFTPQPPRQVTVNEPIENVRVVVRNSGNGNALPFRVRFVWQQSTPNPTSAGSYCVFPRGLEAGGTASCNATINVPPTLVPGNASLGAFVDDERVNGPEPAGIGFPLIEVRRQVATQTPPESAHPHPENYDRTWLYGNAENRAWVKLTFDPRTELGLGDLVYVSDLDGRQLAGSPFRGKELAGRTLYVVGPLAAVRLVSDEAGSGWGLRASEAEVGPPLPESQHPFDSPGGTVLTWRYVHPEEVTSLAVTFDRETYLRADGFGRDDRLTVTDGEGQPVSGSPFTGNSLAGVTLNVLGREVRFSLRRGGVLFQYGLKVGRIEPRFGKPRPILRTRLTGVFGGVVPGTLVNLNAEVSNVGVGAADPFRIGFYWSRTPGPVFQRDRPVGFTCPVTFGLERGESWDCQIRAAVPDDLPPGRWYIIAVADDASRLDLEQPELRVASAEANVLAAGSDLPQSAHPYPNNLDDTQTYTRRGAAWMVIQFDYRSMLEPGDLLFVTDGSGRNIAGSPFSGSRLLRGGFSVIGDTVKFRLVTNGSGNAFGYRVVHIEANSGSAPDAVLIESVEITGEANTAEAGGELAVKFVVRNLSGRPAGGGMYRLYFSQSKEAPAGGQYVFNPPCTFGLMRTDGTLDCTGKVMVPPCLPPGSYHLMVEYVPSISGPIVLNDHLASDRTVLVRSAILTRTTVAPESEHPYAPFTRKSWLFEPPGDHVAIDLTFDPQTEFERNFDYLYLQASDGALGVFTGRDLEARRIRVVGKTVCFFFNADSEEQRFGFRVVRTTLVSGEGDGGPGVVTRRR